MSNGNEVAKPKDLWDKLDVVVKVVTAIVVSAGIAYYGIYSENRRFREAEKTRTQQNAQAESNRQVQIAIQLLTNRESVTADMRTKMFGELIQHYLKRRDPRSKIVVVELMALNLEHVFQLRPLFDDLAAELRPGSKEMRELERVARNAARRQTEEIVGSGGNICELELEKDQPKRADCAPLSLKLVQVNQGAIVLERVEDGKSPLEVPYFDMPLVDNTKRGELRYSIVLETIRQSMAIVKVVVFPRHTFSVQDRLGNDQLIGEYLLQKVETPAANPQRAPNP
jgi:hypothetical protein